MVDLWYNPVTFLQTLNHQLEQADVLDLPPTLPLGLLKIEYRDLKRKVNTHFLNRLLHLNNPFRITFWKCFFFCKLIFVK